MPADRRLTIFLSWSKDQSRAIATLLKAFLEDVLGTPEVFISHEIDPGRRWSTEIAQALERSQAGVIIVTPENVREPWLYFEAGAISKNTDVAHVIPLLWRLSIGELAGTPLTQFQARAIEEEGLRDLCQTMGALAEVPDDVVQRRFSTNWPRLNESLASVPVIGPSASSRTPQIADLMSQLEYMSSKIENVERHLDDWERNRQMDAIRYQYGTNLNEPLYTPRSRATPEDVAKAREYIKRRLEDQKANKAASTEQDAD